MTNVELLTVGIYTAMTTMEKKANGAATVLLSGAKGVMPGLAGKLMTGAKGLISGAASGIKNFATGLGQGFKQVARLPATGIKGFNRGVPFANSGAQSAGRGVAYGTTAGVAVNTPGMFMDSMAPAQNNLNTSRNKSHSGNVANTHPSYPAMHTAGL